MKITALTSHINDGCGWWRIVRPFEALTKLGVDAKYVEIDTYGNVDESLIKDAIVVLHRLAFNDMTFLNKLRKMGAKRLVYEVDDNVFNNDYLTYLRECNRITPSFLKGMHKLVENHQAIVKEVDAIIVSTPELFDVVSEYTDKPIYVLRNTIDFNWFRKQQKVKYLFDGGPIRIGWAGGLRPDTDFAILSKVWGRLADEYKDIKFVVAGYPSDGLYEHVDIARIERIPWKSLNDWPNVYQYDIGCLPLPKNGFNKCKSPIKYYEHAMWQIPVVADNTVYSDTIVDEITGFIATGEQQWYERLKLLIEDEKRRIIVGRTAFYDVRVNYNLADYIRTWKKTFEWIL